MKLKYFFIVFLIVFLLSLTFWWKLLEKKLEDFFFWQEVSKSPEILVILAQQELEKKLENLKPFRNWQIEDLEIDASAAISVEINNEGQEKILFKQNSDKRLPIASLTKLMTANIVLEDENYDLSQKIKISKNAVEEEEDFGNLKVGEIFKIEDLLYPLLMESSNDAATALVEITGKKTFISLMNTKAKILELENTYFANATGLDPDDYNDPINYSTAEDLVKLVNYLLKNQPKIWEVLSASEFKLESPEGVYHHIAKNTDKLLEEIPQRKGGKTGWTPRAGGCLLLVTKSPKSGNYLINIILGARGKEERFEEMKKLINWIKVAYQW